MRGRIFLLSAGFFWLVSIWTLLPSQAAAFNQQITVYATVAPMRAIYINEFGQIIKVGGNTSDNITPKVYDQNNNEVVLNNSIQKQYNDFLKQHSYSLEASKIYYLNPVTVNNEPNLQTIVVQ